MIIKKITTGFVVQTFTTDCEYPIHQEFIAGSEVDYEDEVGEPVEFTSITWHKDREPYLPFDMVQPNPRGVNNTKSVPLPKSA